MTMFAAHMRHRILTETPISSTPSQSIQLAVFAQRVIKFGGCPIGNKCLDGAANLDYCRTSLLSRLHYDRHCSLCSGPLNLYQRQYSQRNSVRFAFGRDIPCSSLRAILSFSCYEKLVAHSKRHIDPRRISYTVAMTLPRVNQQRRVSLMFVH